MNSRERLSKVLNFQKPDRVPIDLGGMRASGIAALAYDKLKKRIGLDSPTKITDGMQILAEIEPEILDHFHIDIVPLDANLADWPLKPAGQGLPQELFAGTEFFYPPGTNITETPAGDWQLCDPAGQPYAQMPKDGYYFDFLRSTMAGRIDPDKFTPRDTIPDEQLSTLQSVARHFYDNTDKAVLGWGMSLSLIGLSWLLGDNVTQVHNIQQNVPPENVEAMFQAAYEWK